MLFFSLKTVKMASNINILNLISSFMCKEPINSAVFYKEIDRLELNEKFSFAYTYLKSGGLLSTIEPDRSFQKSTEKALEYKNLGNENFARGEHIEALKLYTKCAAVALPDSAELAVAYANRSAALYRLERYEACLVDVNRALQENYPEASKPKLRDRKKNCWSKLHERNSSRLRYFKSIEHSRLDDDTLYTDLKYLMKQCEFDIDATDMNYDEKFYLPKVNFMNKIIPNVSEKVKIKFNSEFSRHIVATQDIKVGEILAIEKPYASFLPLTRQYSHCANCFMRCESLIPCLTCSTVMFCSKRCRENAFDRFHRIECQYSSLFNYVQAGAALRLLMIATKQGEELEAMMEHPVYKNPFKKAVGDVSQKFDPTNYANIHNLEDNFDKRKNDNDTFNLRIQMVVVLIHILKHSTFFNESNDQDIRNLTKKETYASILLFKFILAISCNCFQITEYPDPTHLTASDVSEKVCSGEDIGTGIYSFLSLFNHSCKQNIFGSFHKDTVVTRSSHPIRAGEQLFMNYGSRFEFMIRSQRQQFLCENYFFECRCEPCENNWPLYNNLPSAKLEIMNSKKLNRYAIKMGELFSTLQHHQSGKLYDFICEYMTLLCQNTKLPNQEHQECCGKLMRMCNARGNFYESNTDLVLLFL